MTWRTLRGKPRKAFSNYGPGKKQLKKSRASKTRVPKSRVSKSRGSFGSQVAKGLGNVAGFIVPGIKVSKTRVSKPRVSKPRVSNTKRPLRARGSIRESRKTRG